MKSRTLLTIGMSSLAATMLGAQAPTPTPPRHPGVQAAADPGEAQVLAACKNKPPAPQPGAARGGGAAPANAGPVDSTIKEIPGVIAANQKWTMVWQTEGNNADGIVGTNDGGLLIAQNSNSAVVKLDRNGKASVVYKDTNTGGALSMNKKGDLFVAERALNPAIWELAPKRRMLANMYMGDPLDCLGGVLNDISADSRGGVYFTQNGLYYANPMGVVSKYGENLRTNGIILSGDEKTLYVTNGPAVAAFDVQPDGSLKNQRELAKLPFGNGDGSTIDAEGRLYVTGGNAIHVIGADGKYLGNIPTPGNAITVAFSGPDKKTLFTVISLRNPNVPGIAGISGAQVFSVAMTAQGYKGRAK